MIFPPFTQPNSEIKLQHLVDLLLTSDDRERFWKELQDCVLTNDFMQSPRHWIYHVLTSTFTYQLKPILFHFIEKMLYEIKQCGQDDYLMSVHNAIHAWIKDLMKEEELS